MEKQSPRPMAFFSNYNLLFFYSFSNPSLSVAHPYRDYNKAANENCGCGSGIQIGEESGMHLEVLEK